MIKVTNTNNKPMKKPQVAWEGWTEDELKQLSKGEASLIPKNHSKRMYKFGYETAIRIIIKTDLEELDKECQVEKENGNGK